MCEHGDTVTMRVPIPPWLSHTGHFEWADKPVDRCLVPIVQALNRGRVYTANSCCGHGKGPGAIVLHSRRELVIEDGRRERLEG